MRVFALVVTFLLLSGTSNATPISITWTNVAEATYPPATKALLCVNEFCSLAPTICNAGETCTTSHNLPPGSHTAYLLISSEEFGYVWSVPVPSPLVIPDNSPGVCFHDANGDGNVSTADFGSFLNEFRNGCM